MTPADARDPQAQVHLDGREHVAVHGHPLGGAAGPDVGLEGGLQRSAQKRYRLSCSKWNLRPWIQFRFPDSATVEMTGSAEGEQALSGMFVP